MNNSGTSVGSGSEDCYGSGCEDVYGQGCGYGQGDGYGKDDGSGSGSGHGSGHGGRIREDGFGQGYRDEPDDGSPFYIHVHGAGYVYSSP